MKREMKNILVIFSVFLIILAGQGIRYYKSRHYAQSIRTLTSLRLQEITTFKVYPEAGRPTGEWVEFRDSDPIINEFLKSLTDQRPANSSLIHDGAQSEKHNWFLEITAEGKMLQIKCYIPARKSDVVVGEFCNYQNGKRNAPYGSFQSKQLYQWYQTYSHRWLTPEE